MYLRTYALFQSVSADRMDVYTKTSQGTGRKGIEEGGRKEEKMPVFRQSAKVTQGHQGGSNFQTEGKKRLRFVLFLSRFKSYLLIDHVYAFHGVSDFSPPPLCSGHFYSSHAAALLCARRHIYALASSSMVVAIHRDRALKVSCWIHAVRRLAYERESVRIFRASGRECIAPGWRR